MVGLKFSENRVNLKKDIMNNRNNSNWWVLVGSEKNWDYAIQGATGIWGVRDKSTLKRHWDKLQGGDYVIFYVTSPVKGVVGYGRIESKNKQNKPVWPDEVKGNQVIYPWRFYFEILNILPVGSWREESLNIKGIPFQAGLSPISNLRTIKTIIETIKERWNEQLEFKKEEVVESKKKRKLVSLHDQIKEMIYEIGKEEKFISEKEIQIDGERLDVTWKRVMRGVPTKVFEVQISGSIHQALGKLKHSFDLWNSEPYLIIREKDRRKAEELLSGTFHEIRDIVKIITTNKVEKFYSFLKESSRLKKDLGL